MNHILTERDWICPYCRRIIFNGENKLRHLAKHEPAVRKLLRRNFIMMIRETLRMGIKTENSVRDRIRE